MDERARALIFDLDGTIADSMPLHWRAWQALMRRHQFHFSRERLYALGGIPSRHIVEMLSREQGLTLDTQAIAREKETEYLALLEQVKPIPPVLDIAREHYQEIPLAIASGGSRRVIEKVLAHLRVRYLFDAVITHEDLLREAWGENYTDATASLSLYIRYLREKIEEDPSLPRYIMTKWGIGYWFAEAETPDEKPTEGELLGR